MVLEASGGLWDRKSIGYFHLVFFEATNLRFQLAHSCFWLVFLPPPPSPLPPQDGGELICTNLSFVFFIRFAPKCHCDGVETEMTDETRRGIPDELTRWKGVGWIY